jgi:hypothetical protein
MPRSQRYTGPRRSVNLDEILTLEPFLDAVRRGVETAGWRLSGLQKTTSLEFEGRWEGESTRSAYLFFHRADATDDVSIEAYLDETSQGLTGNLALVVDLAPLARIGHPGGALDVLGHLARREVPSAYPAPLTLRLRLPDGGTDPGEAEVETRFKLTFPGGVIAAGGDEVSRVALEAVSAFERILRSGELARYRDAD